MFVEWVSRKHISYGCVMRTFPQSGPSLDWGFFDSTMRLRDGVPSEAVFDILVLAVTLAKDLQVRSIEALRALLLERCPGKEGEISEAIAIWANQIAKSEV